jgi:carboxypeptidase C (cathepsin A)
MGKKCAMHPLALVAALLPLLLPLLLLSADAAPAADEVLSLPGWDGELPSKQYSGYLDLPSTNKHLHYWAVLSEGDPSADPVAFWFNGGPGCSSVDGFLYEHGPFHVNADDYSKLDYFNYTWAKHATMVYLEAPAGVGFSYSDDAADYTTDDDQTALDNLAAVETWFAAFPEYLESDFFITGESYAGVYVPTLAEAILNATNAGTYTGAPLRGIAVGNGCSGNEIGICSWGVQGDYYETSYLTQLAFIPASLKSSIAAECDWSGAANNTDTRSAACKALLAQLQETVGNVNVYNVYGECVSGSAQEVEGRSVLKAPRIDPKTGKPRPPAWATTKEDSSGQQDAAQSVVSLNACIDSRAAAGWINQPAVLEALHVKQQPYDWAICGNQISYT